MKITLPRAGALGCVLSAMVLPSPVSAFGTASGLPKPAGPAIKRNKTDAGDVRQHAKRFAPSREETPKCSRLPLDGDDRTVGKAEKANFEKIKNQAPS